MQVLMLPTLPTSHWHIIFTSQLGMAQPPTQPSSDPVPTVFPMLTRSPWSYCNINNYTDVKNAVIWCLTINVEWVQVTISKGNKWSKYKCYCLVHSPTVSPMLTRSLQSYCIILYHMNNAWQLTQNEHRSENPMENNQNKFCCLVLTYSLSNAHKMLMIILSHTHCIT